jgi:DNA repair protein RadD
MLKDQFEVHGIEVDLVTGEDGKNKRNSTLAKFKSGQTRCLINVNVLTTGFDAPSVDLVALVRATASQRAYTSRWLGRGTRLSEGKENCLVLDYGQNVERHGFIDQVKPKDKIGWRWGWRSARPRQCESMPDNCSRSHVRSALSAGFEFPAPTLKPRCG